MGIAVELQLALALAGGDTKARLEKLAIDLQEAQDEAARLALRIHPPLLAERGLGLALRSIVANARVEVTEDAALPPELASVVYLGVVEALGQFPAAAPSTVSVRAGDGELRFEIVHAVAAADPAGSLEDVRHRLEAFGGELTVFRADGELRVSGWVPYSA